MSMALKFAVPIILVLCVHGHKGFAGGIISTAKSVICKPLMRRANGFITYHLKDDVICNVGSKAYLSCDSHYVINGNKVTTCCTDGIWRPSLGTCKLTPGINPNFCQPYINNRTITLHYRSTSKKIPLGTAIIAECPIGQRILGNPTSKCVEGIWKPILGICVDKN
uniref:Sushi domain-containing protein n=1 Tax=Onchocerca volvulus TaxID=6282 RepID=A0A8R1XS58_ONCVO